MPGLGIGVILAVFQSSGNVEAKREALTSDVIKGSVINRLSLIKDSSWHLVNPRSLIRRHCVYDFVRYAISTNCTMQTFSDHCFHHANENVTTIVPLFSNP